MTTRHAAWLGLVAAGALALGGAVPVGAQGAGVKKVAVVVPASRTDHGWNQQAPDALDKLAKKLGFQLEVAENAGYRDIKPILRDLTAKGAELIVCHASGYVTVCPEYAKETNTKVSVVTRRDAVVPGLVSAVETFAHEAAFVAGVVAGTVTKTNTVGIVVSGETPTWNYMTVGFAEGLHSVKPSARLLYGVIGQAAFEDAPGGKRLTEAQLGAGADVIFGQGDGASFGMMNAIADLNRRGGGKKAWFIDVIGDKRDIDRDKLILTSILFDYNGVYEEMVGDVGRGKFGRIYTMNLANNGVRLIDLPAEVGPAPGDAAKAAREKIVAGQTKVSLVGAIPDMRKRLRELFPASIQ